MILSKSKESEKLTSDEKVVLEMLLNNCVSTRHNNDPCFGQLKDLWNKYPEAFKHINMSFTETELVMIACLPGLFMTREIEEDFEITFYGYITNYDQDLLKLEDLYFYEVFF